MKAAVKKKKIVVHLIFSFTLGGAENLIADLINNQVASANVYLIIINDLYDTGLIQTIDPVAKVFLINRKVGSINIFKILRVNFLIASIKPDVIHCHNETAIKALFIYQNKTVVTIHDVKMDVNLFFKYKRVVAISKIVKEDVEQRSKRTLKAEVVYNGLNFTSVNRKDYCKLNNEVKLVQVSRLIHDKKGQDILIKAVDFLKRKKGFNVKLYLIGTGPSLAFLQKLIDNYSLKENVFIIENKDRTWVHENLKKFDILIQPSRYEGFGLTIIEAIAAKLPVIASNLEGPKEILADGKYGELFTSGDSLDLAQKIEKIIIAYQSGEVKAKTEMAYDYAKEHFSLQKMLLGYERVYENLN